MSVKAISKGVSISPRKVSVVAALVRGRTVAEAITILENTPRRAAVPVRKTIESARANADYNHGFKPDTLFITEISVTPGPRMRRFRPVARGMAHPYLHRSTHIRVVVDGEKRAPKKPASATTAKAPSAKANAETKKSEETK